MGFFGRENTLRGVPEGIGIPRNHVEECMDCRRGIVCGHVLLLVQKSVGDR
jgi:hypothetical protein